MSSEIPESCSHFNSVKFNDTSVFTSKFPVPLNNEHIRDVVKSQIPSQIDTLFTLRGSQESFETVSRKGAIPLRPTSTQIVINSLLNHEKRIMRSRHFVLEALTDGTTLTTAHAQVDRDSGTMQDFSLAIAAMDNQKPVNFELRAVINNPTENVYEVARLEDGHEVNSILIDEDAAQKFVHSLRELHNGQDIESTPLEASLLSLVDTSPDVEHLQHGVYDINGNANLTLSIERRSRIQKGIARTISYALLLQETSFNSQGETIRSFNLGYDDAKDQHYWSNLNYLIRAFDPKLTHDKRELIFGDFSVFFREHPEVLFDSLEAATTRLATLG